MIIDVKEIPPSWRERVRSHSSNNKDRKRGLTGMIPGHVGIANLSILLLLALPSAFPSFPLILVPVVPPNDEGLSASTHLPYHPNDRERSREPRERARSHTRASQLEGRSRRRMGVAVNRRRVGGKYYCKGQEIGRRD
jgi:hypothetical protein